MKGLIADDEALSRRLLEKALERAGYEVIAVENGEQALEQLCKPEGPRLALLDWVMPEPDGLGVYRAARKRSEQTYVYMMLLTSNGPKEETVLGLESGADDYLTKPFNAEELRARLRVENAFCCSKTGWWKPVRTCVSERPTTRGLPC